MLKENSFKFISTKIEIIIKNKKDYVDVYIKNYSQVNKSYYYEYEEPKKYLQRINPKVLPYPNRLGSGSGKCAVWDIFQQIGLLECGQESIYKFYSVSEILNMTSKNEDLLKKCKESQNCGYIIEKMLNNEYKGLWEGGSGKDDISIELEEDKYSLDEGKHRVCMAKRFDIADIPVEITENIRKEKKYYDDDMILFKRQYTCHEIMKHCYETLENIGISNEDAHELLKLPIANLELVNFIENKAGMNIYQIKNKCYNSNKINRIIDIGMKKLQMVEENRRKEESD